MCSVFWLACCLVSWVSSGWLMLASWDAFQNNAISFVVESTYLDWDTTFPSISVCEEDNMERVYQMSAKSVKVVTIEHYWCSANKCHIPDG